MYEISRSGMLQSLNVCLDLCIKIMVAFHQRFIVLVIPEMDGVFSLRESRPIFTPADENKNLTKCYVVLQLRPSLATMRF